MSLILDPGVEDRLVAIGAKNSLRAQREVARVFAFLRRLEEKMIAGSADFWNVGPGASGKLAAGATRRSGESLWRLYPKHYHCVGILSKNGDVRVLAVCSRSELAEIERSLCA
jgi:hypothetical protein